MESIIYIVILIFSVVLHELAHGYAAEKLGDPTPRLAGRLTLNPLKHLDLFGSVLLPLFLVMSGSSIIIGWAKPVPFNPRYFRDKRWGPALVALAGPLANIFIAVIFAFFLKLGLGIFEGGSLLTEVIVQIVIMNIVLALFNLIPIPPLDGHHILFALLGNCCLSFKRFLVKYHMVFLMLFILFGWKYISPLVRIIASWIL